MKKIYQNKASFIFNILAVFIIVVSLFIYQDFKDTKEEIKSQYSIATKSYVEEFSKNIIKSLKSECGDDIYSTLLKNPKKRVILEKYLQLFVTKKYKYIYILNRDKGYRFLLDGSHDLSEKGEFGENYEPLEVNRFDDVYRSKKEAFFYHKQIKSLWMTYLAPIIIDNHVEAILVVDFSQEDYKIISDTLENYDNSFLVLIAFFIVVFFIILWFSKMDKKRENEKSRAFENLKTTTKKLQQKSEMVEELNTTLEKRVAVEVAKNREKDQQLLQQSRLAQMGEMLSMIAHQWRQPLSAISASSASLELKAQLGTLKDEDVLSKAKNISSFSQHLSSTINDFRDFFKEQKEEKEVTYAELIESVLKIIKISIENKNIEIIQEIKTQKRFFTYPNELKQVIINLIKNAEDVLIEKDIKNPFIKIIAYSENDLEILEVHDNAGGILENIIDKIFEPYFSTKLEKNGTGLGLYMSKKIVEQHCRGKLTVQNGEEGAIFKISLRNQNL